MLKFKVTNLEEVDEAHRDLYEEKEIKGAKVWLLKVEGAVDRDKLNEFRDNNIAQRKKIEELTDLWAGVDMSPEEVKELVAKADQIRSSKAKGSEEIEAELKTRTDRLKAEHAAAMKKVQDENARLDQGLTSLTIDQAAITAATKKGLRASAIMDLTSRARMLFKLQDGRPTAYEGDGKTVRFGKDATPLEIPEWVETLTAEAPHLFEPSSGSGASGNGSGGAGASKIKNPWKAETHNLTEQMRIIRKDPKLAKRLEAEATG